MKVTAFVPAYNNESTIEQVVESLRVQTIAAEEVFVIDDGSTDGTSTLAGGFGIRVVSMGSNLGRGSVRARSIVEANDSDLILSVDATAALAPDFAERVRPWFDDPRVAAVYGRIGQREVRTVADRWRARHLYRTDEVHTPRATSSLITWGVMLRVAAVREVGNFNPDCRHSEDAELGDRLTAAGWKIIYEPSAQVTTLVSNSLSQVLERYWRWNLARNSKMTPLLWLRFWWYNLKVMVAGDLKRKDLPCALISSILPYTCAWKSIRQTQSRRFHHSP